MAHAKNKAELIAQVRKERKALEALIATLSPEEMTRPGMIGEWSVKDILAHLVEWEQMFLAWYHAGLVGMVAHTPAEGYKWNQLPALNQAIYERHRQRPLAEVLAGFESSFREIFQAVEAMSEEVLFTPGCYAWTNKHALVGWVEANTSSHYHWAWNGVRKGLKSRS
jgi:uncharacterized protein (TIGR03083 family)